VNVDLCFVPATRTTTERKLPAVSGSSGRLVVERVRDQTAELSYPGRAFDDPQRSYAEAMQAFVAATPVAAPLAGTPDPSSTDAAPDRHAQQRRLGQEAVALRAARRALRQQRQREDAAWRAARLQHHTRQQPQAQRCTAGRLAVLAHPADQLSWRVRRLQRRLVLAHRRREDRAWRAQRQRLREHLAQRPPGSAWIAILVITDNCSRQCIALPLFVAGAKVTAAMVVDALRSLLPPDLQFLISDRGTHFTAQVFAQLAQEQAFIHVLIARHRPQSNGIAERFVRTLKAWLADKIWQSTAELEGLLQQFRAEYNDRPHQGVGIPGLSPNEFANRIGLL
jgi:transposase InsO family protein